MSLFHSLPPHGLQKVASVLRPSLLLLHSLLPWVKVASMGPAVVFAFWAWRVRFFLFVGVGDISENSRDCRLSGGVSGAFLEGKGFEDAVDVTGVCFFRCRGSVGLLSCHSFHELNLCGNHFGYVLFHFSVLCCHVGNLVFEVINVIVGHGPVAVGDSRCGRSELILFVLDICFDEVRPEGFPGAGTVWVFIAIVSSYPVNKVRDIHKVASGGAFHGVDGDRLIGVTELSLVFLLSFEVLLKCERSIWWTGKEFHDVCNVDRSMFVELGFKMGTEGFGCVAVAKGHNLFNF